MRLRIVSGKDFAFGPGKAEVLAEYLAMCAASEKATQPGWRKLQAFLKS